MSKKWERDLSVDGSSLVIVGGGFRGCAGALAICESGLNVLLTEEINWLGGQVTSQEVPPRV
ncbi:FAD-dependent oxidoreductase [Gracilibacillus salitolerans]|uniref:FAD-dependent oxidoreductase n=1 Tax=Gracilibacillus salitolerans TaxID=2663022 RepID=A0A5Q2TS38_9BACI|nr:FAD-dependent oxidoreductase [Gracilibacillus salitolerans]